MKSTFFKALLIINLLFLHNCKAQTTNDYINFYNNVVPKLNTIAPNKTQFYGQNFSNFYNELQNKNVSIMMLNYDTKSDNDIKYFVLDLYLSDISMWSVASKNDFQYPWISITFENEIPNQIKSMVEQSNSKWNNTFEQFFSNMKIEKIKFVGVRGYDNPDFSGK
ncbi:hypothetical protein [Chryseobacterium taihuense]|uniref:Uncharacterized protein n=1 Tax=Chryseobacterium taihuense TaxID=1141221 RepID=A0ABY0R3T7_9FLAO|nr:hypothetical protein [Chryseobacterium taihuense]SDM38139.1 hypothetical protein SAMN05216273_12824 [Chryseobacterium taihuense]